jgi:hypothetical protein
MTHFTTFILKIFLIFEFVMLHHSTLSYSISLHNNLKSSLPPSSLQHPNAESVDADEKKKTREYSFIRNPMEQVEMLMDSISDAMYGEKLTEKLLYDSRVQNHMTKSSLVLEDEEGDFTNPPNFKRSNFVDVYPNPFKNAAAWYF